MPSNPAEPIRRRVRHSALWAAYGDALGFITEGVDGSGVRRRVGEETVQRTTAWKRRVGGKMGTLAELPAGCLSDDTQLRLATSRSIRGQGEFDVETFAKIELTVWPCYALGAGVGSTRAAANLRRRDVTWDTNFFADKRSHYMQGGGNGAAMRIQPHVWSHHRERDDAALIAAVVRNAVVTHGHLRGILGAAFHALCLHRALTAGAVPDPAEWHEVVARLQLVPEIVAADPALSELWLGQWTMRSDKPFHRAVIETLREVRKDLHRCEALRETDPVSAYEEAVIALDARRPEQRGSGTKTAVLAILLSGLFGGDPEGAVLTAANCLGTDTDTIATMAGAISGAIAKREPEAPLCDRAYLVHEADRMAAIASGEGASAFRYPSLVSWTAPRSASDCVGVSEGALALAGLGAAEQTGPEFDGGGRHPAVWQWLKLWFGQQVFAKRKPHPEALSTSQRMEAARPYLEAATAEASLVPEPPRRGRPEQFAIDGLEKAPKPNGAGGRGQQRPQQPTIHELTREAIGSGFDAELIGRTLRTLMDREDGIEASIAYTSILAKAWISRRGPLGPS